MPGEEYLYQIERQVPGFGGMYYDDAGDLVIYLKDLKLADAARAAVKPYKSRGKYGLMDPRTPAAEIRFRQGQFSFIELNNYYRWIAAWQLPGVFPTDVDESLNHVEVSVQDTEARQVLLAALERARIPRQAIFIFSCEAVPERCHWLHRPDAEAD
jgi:hypothetical protein